MNTPWALTIAGSDPSGGAGLQADLKAFSARGVQGAAVPTLITVQSVRGVKSVQPLDPTLVASQLDTVLADTPLQALKTGALHNAPLVRAVGKALQNHTRVPWVVDPIILSGNGHRLLDDHGVWAMTETLIPRCALITPNADEASVLTRRPVRNESEAREAAVAIQALGARAVLIKGGHLQDGNAVDVLFDGAQFHTFETPRLNLPRVHGAGCLLSAVITAQLARGDSVLDAVGTAKKLMNRALQNATITEHGVALPDVFSLRD